MTLILSGTDSSVSAPAVQGGTAGTTTGVYYPATNQLALATNGTQAVLVDSSQNVGIGTTPVYKLDVYGGASGTRTDIVARNASANLNIAVLSDNNGAVSSTNSTLFYTNATERMRIDSSGNLLVGETTQTGSGKAEILQSTNNQGLAVVATNATYTNDAFIIYASRNTTNASYNAMAYYNSGAGAYKFKLTDGGNISLFGGQITFPAAQSASSDANTLDDYEEGTVTYPLILGGSTITSGYGTNQCKYTKIGNTVNCFYYLDYTGSSGVITISLPFASASTASIIIPIDPYSNQYGYVIQALWIQPGNNYGSVSYDVNVNNAFNLAAGNRFYLRCSFSYPV